MTKTSVKNVQLTARRDLVVALRLQGGSFGDIAAQLLAMPEAERVRLGVTDNYCAVYAFRDCMAELTRLNKHAQEGIAEVKRLELDRLDALLASRWEKAVGGDDIAFDKVLLTMERRARYLGLDAPVKQEQSGEVVQVAMTLAEWQKQRAERGAAAREAEDLVGVA